MKVDPKITWALEPECDVWRGTPNWNYVVRTGRPPRVYFAVKCFGHQRAWANGYVHVHVLVAEQKLGRALRPEEVVHHIDEDTTNNHVSNIKVFPTAAEHSRLHQKNTRVTLYCDECKKPFQRIKSRIRTARFCSNSCRGRYTRRRQLALGTGPKKKRTLEERRCRKALYMREWRKRRSR